MDALNEGDSKKKKETPGQYMLPAGIGMALGAGRAELMNVGITQMESGQVEPTVETMVELTRLARDLMQDKLELLDKVETLEEELENKKEVIREIQEAINNGI